VSDMSWTKKISHPSELLKKNDTVKCVVLSVDQEKMRVALGLKQLTEDPWLNEIPSHYLPGQIVRGKVTKITNFGVFVELEQDLEGLLHVSELADHKVEDPHDEVSKKRAEWAAEDGSAAAGKPKARRGGLHGPGEDSTDLIQDFPLRQAPGAESPDKAKDSGESADPAAPTATSETTAPAESETETEAVTEPDAGADEQASDTPVEEGNDKDQGST